MNFIVKVHGHVVEFSDELNEAQEAFKDARKDVELWAVASDGNAVLLQRK